MGYLSDAKALLPLFLKPSKRKASAIYDILSIRSGKKLEQVERDCDRNKWLNAKETVEYGLADTILERMAAP